MDFKLLHKIMSDYLIDLDVNKYENAARNTAILAEEYIRTIKNCSSRRIKNSKVNFYYKENLFGSLSGQVPSTSQMEGIKLCKDKLQTETLLKRNNILTTDSVLLSKNDYQKGLDIIKSNDIPMVLKPFNLSAGKGVTLNVDEDTYDFAWTLIKKEYASNPRNFKAMLQPMLAGIETRMLIVEGKFHSAILRVPANVTGNGIDTIQELIDAKNNQRQLNPHLKNLNININEALLHNINVQNKSLATVPDLDETVFLYKSSNVSLGGDSIEISHLVGDALIELAEQAVAVVPGISTAGVDIMFENFNDKNAKVLEINPGANLRMHHYPLKGQPKTPIHDLIDSLLKNHKEKIMH